MQALTFMHFPVVISIGSFQLPAHFLCETLAYFVGYRYYLHLRKTQHDLISDQHRMLIFIGAAAGAFIGSHLIGILERPSGLSHFSVLYLMGNKTILGGLLGGLIGVELTKKQIGVSVSSGDLMVYPLILAMAIGRIGCFLAGLEDGTYGLPTSLPWGINFGDGIYRHPTNLYEILFWCMLWLMLFTAGKRYTYTNGSLFKLLMTSYLLFRFGVEFIKPHEAVFARLSVIQLACTGGLLYYYKVFIKPSQLYIHA